MNERLVNKGNAERFWTFRNRRPDFVQNLLGESATDHDVSELTTKLVELVKEIAIGDFCKGYIHPDGSFRWMSNDRAPFADTMDRMEAFGVVHATVVAATAEVRERQLKKSIEDYRANYTKPSSEELEEMRAAFGKGATVVNVLTGHQTRL